MSPIVILLDERWIRTDTWVKIPGQRLPERRNQPPRQRRPET